MSKACLGRQLVSWNAVNSGLIIVGNRGVGIAAPMLLMMLSCHLMLTKLYACLRLFREAKSEPSSSLLLSEMARLAGFRPHSVGYL